MSPNNSAYTIEDIKIINNVIQGCQGGLGSIGLVSNDKESPAKKILIKENVILDTYRGVCFMINSQSSTENIQVIGNEFRNCKNPLLLRGSGSSKNWTIKRNAKIKKLTFTGELEIKNLRTDVKWNDK